jgi:hypothetical protein
MQGNNDVSLVIRKHGHLSDDDRATLDRLLAPILPRGPGARDMTWTCD